MKFSDQERKQLENEFVFSAGKSSGPGGQNVNKVSTRVELRFSIAESSVLNEIQKERIRLKLKNRINLDDELILVSQVERSQIKNKQNVIELFFTLTEKALTIPKKRIKTSPTSASRIKRLDSKKINALKKQMRKPPEH